MKSVSVLLPWQSWIRVSPEEKDITVSSVLLVDSEQMASITFSSTSRMRLNPRKKKC